MRAFSVWALPALALVGLGLIAGPSAFAETDPIITGDPATAVEPRAPAPPAPYARPRVAKATSPVESPQPAAEAPAPTTQAERLDSLFAALKKTSAQDDAARIAAKIDAEWSQSGSATVDLMLFWATQAAAKQNSAAALDLLEQAIILDPDYAEAWNRRATLNYQISDYGKSIADIQKTLILEPRHYGALMGLGMILEETDRKPQALEAYTKVLDIYPANKSAQDAVGRLAEELTGQGI
jgi:tetratricopeptide (TPR) repeat protein